MNFNSHCSSISELCEPGEKVHDDTCADCPSNTYSDTYQATECPECPVGFTSREGSASCDIIAS